MTNLKMGKTKVRVIIKYLQKKSMRLEEIQILTKDCSSNSTVKKWAVEFKQDKDSIENDPQSGHPKLLPLINKSMPFTV